MLSHQPLPVKSAEWMEGGRCRRQEQCGGGVERWGEQTGMKKRSAEIERVIHLAGGSGEIRKRRMGKTGRSGCDGCEKMRWRLRWGETEGEGGSNVRDVTTKTFPSKIVHGLEWLQTGWSVTKGKKRQSCYR